MMKMGKMDMEDMSESEDAMDEANDKPGEDAPDEHELSCAVDTVIKAEEIKADAKMWPHVKEALKAKGVAVNKAVQRLKTLKKSRMNKSNVKKEL